MTNTPAERKAQERKRKQEWLKAHRLPYSTGEALLTAIMKLDAKQIETLRRMVEQKGN